MGRPGSQRRSIVRLFSPRSSFLRRKQTKISNRWSPHLPNLLLRIHQQIHLSRARTSIIALILILQMTHSPLMLRHYFRNQIRRKLPAQILLAERLMISSNVSNNQSINGSMRKMQNLYSPKWWRLSNIWTPWVSPIVI